MPLNYSKSRHYAAIDLGSNSFHLLVANWDNGRLQTLDREKSYVRLAQGLTARQEISQATQK